MTVRESNLPIHMYKGHLHIGIATIPLQVSILYPLAANPIFHYPVLDYGTLEEQRVKNGEAGPKRLWHVTESKTSFIRMKRGIGGNSKVL